MPSQMFAIVAPAIITTPGVALVRISIFSLMLAMFPPALIAIVAIVLRQIKKRKKKGESSSTSGSAS